MCFAVNPKQYIGFESKETLFDVSEYGSVDLRDW